MTRNEDEIARLETLLAEAGPPRLPDRARFVDQVMGRVAASGREAPRLEWQPAPSLPWWVQAAADPAAVLACVLMALVLWKPQALTVLARAATGWSLPAWLPVAWARSTLDRPAIALGLQILGSILLAWASLQLYRWTERLARRATRAPSRSSRY